MNIPGNCDRKLNNEKKDQSIDDHILKIRSGNITNSELVTYLDETNIFILSNAIIQILTKKIFGNTVVDKLAKISTQNELKHTFPVIKISIGFFATAALFIINTPYSIAKYDFITAGYCDDDLEKLQTATVALKDIVGRNTECLSRL